MKLVEAQLVASLREQASTRVHVSLVREASKLNDQLENYVAQSKDELCEMVAFFVNRSARAPNSETGRRDLERALDLSNGIARDANLQPSVPRLGRGASFADVARGIADPLELSQHIAASTERLVAVSVTDRYLGVSDANAVFNHTTPARMIDLHIEQVIGKRRYIDRAGPALEACLRHGSTAYVYPFTVETQGQRFIRCEMHPIRDRTDRPYCTLMRLTDVTSGMQRGDPLQELPGTT
ncbi:hypothetical protein ILP92_07535 [Maribius pontilimi]|uniref:PAS fold-containing protein n=1 Tax=Palleronia pontilimi TaxID=1964209 RepID=A0A934I908_9RHOB|nr:hypothetical protein [Palleronia pontilimi]MBJ3762593.1 hypothetical protein [Palleronia pontilimi]